jgi:hypothetical protein
MIRHHEPLEDDRIKMMVIYSCKQDNAQPLEGTNKTLIEGQPSDDWSIQQDPQAWISQPLYLLRKTFRGWLVYSHMIYNMQMPNALKNKMQYA